MILTEDQIAFYHENGYLCIENFLNESEVELLNREFPKTVEAHSPRIVYEDNGEVRSVFAPHHVNQHYSRLSRLDRVVLPVRQLLANDIYLYQYKINMKKGRVGDRWEWHQDFPYWHYDDGVPRPEMLSVLLYLQDTNYENGALLVIPGTHAQGIAKFQDKEILKDNSNDLTYRSSLGSNIKFTVDNALVKTMSESKPVVTIGGKRGMVTFFHCNIFHASNPNLSDADRAAVILTFNGVTNLPTNQSNPRPEFLVNRDVNAIRQLEVSL